ncbi:MAG: hypothetical protein Q8L35_01585 [Actinomycetota bacterium]|nr:hypothetical protein [Actinomycetota bacterium]
MSASEAESMFNDLLRDIKNESLSEGTSNLPANYGDVLLQKEVNDEETRLILSKKRTEGVRDEDIRSWWNMHDLERRMAIKVDDFYRMCFGIEEFKQSTGDLDEIAARIRKIFPIYGDPDDTSNTTGADTPLPYELKDRINKYIEKTMQTNAEKSKKEIKASSTYNAFVRKEIAKGNI